MKRSVQRRKAWSFLLLSKALFLWKNAMNGTKLGVRASIQVQWLPLSTPIPMLIPIECTVAASVNKPSDKPDTHKCLNCGKPGNISHDCRAPRMSVMAAVMASADLTEDALLACMARVSILPGISALSFLGGCQYL